MHSTSQLIARRVRECGVYCEIIPYNYSLDKIKAKNPKAIILSGGPNSVYAENTPSVDEGVFELGIPVLGICYGDQFMTKALGGVVAHAEAAVNTARPLWSWIPRPVCSPVWKKNNVCWMSHQDYAEKAPEGFTVIAHTDECPIAAMQNEEKKLYGVQFHPEVMHTPFGKQMFSNFLVQYLQPVRRLDHVFLCPEQDPGNP